MPGSLLNRSACAVATTVLASAAELIVADSLCPQIAELQAGALHDLVNLGSSVNPLAAVTAALTERRLLGKPVGTLHIVAHGRAGAFQIGGQWITAATLIANAAQLAKWQVDTIALWSCEVGADARFVALLEELTGARVWSSSSRLGRLDQASVWQLKQSTTGEGLAAPWSTETLQAWPHQLATYTFSSAFQVTNEAGKETSFHTFNSGAPLPGVTITDGSTVREFSGNDISAQAVVIGGVTYFGWVSRPIKVQGQVVGFYFWTDRDFTSLALAQADGNADKDGSTADNLGFVLVVAGKESFFSSGGIGSSSDRVDSALNSLLPPPNTAPVAVADVANGTPGTDGGAALEAGGVNNGTAGFNATGNVLTNDTDADVGDTKRVSSASGANGATTSVASSTTSANGTVLTGQYGTLTIGADGSYRYVVDNDNSTVQALRTSANTLSDVFTYTMVDTAGASSTTTLTVVVQGANDAPDANNDTNTAKESLIADGVAGQYVSGTDPLGATATGNVLPNDTDVDSGDTKTVTGATITGAASSTGSSGGSGVTTLSFSSLPSNVSVGYYVFLDDGTLNNSGRGALLTTSGGTPIQIASIDTVSRTFTLSGTPSTPINNGDFLGFANTTGGAAYRDAQVSGVGSSATSTINLSGVTGTIAVGMTVQGTGLPTAPVITAVTYSGSSISSITIDQTLSGSLTGPLTFSGFSAAGSLLTGAYGTLLLNSDGSYTYTPFAQNPALLEGQTATEVFTYEMRDTAGLTDTATLTITVLGSGTPDPNAVADVADGTPGTPGGAAVEAGGVNNGTAGFEATGNVLTNDTTPATTDPLSVTGIANLSSSTFGLSATGLYGSIVINAAGQYTYTINNDNATIQALNSGQTLTETFQYQVTNSAGRFDVTTLTITINGANDAPVAVNDNGVAVENGGSPSAPVAGFNPSGDVLDNDSDVDNTAAQLSLSGIRTGSEAGSGSAGTVGSALAGTYGSLTINPDGTWSYAVDQANPAVNALAPGQTLSETFTYTVRDSAGATDTAELTITINGADDSVDINDVTVNEGSPTAVFTLTGQPGVAVTLSLENVTTTGLSGLQYYNGRDWVDYTGAPVLIGDTGSLLVRTAITPEQETALDGPESFTLTATVVGGSSSRGTGTIVDDGTGSYFATDNNTGISAIPAGVLLDDDRALTVNSPTVNEGSPVATFEVTGAVGQRALLALRNASGDGGTDPAGNKADLRRNGVLPTIQYFDGTNWQNYDPANPPAILDGGKLLVRVDITAEQEAALDGPETFLLDVTNTGGTTVTGTATIVDDGTGSYFATDNNTGISTIPAGVLLDDDRPPSRFTLRTDSDSDAITDRVTANGNPELQLIGPIGRSNELVIKYADGAGRVLTPGTNYTVREVTLADQPGKAIYIIDLIDANTGAIGNQAYGDYYQGATNANNGGFGDGLYTVHYNGAEVGDFRIDTEPLSEARRLQCLTRVFGQGQLAFESALFGYRTEKGTGTKGDDILTGNSTTGVSFNGNKGSDLLNGVGYRFNDDGTISDLSPVKKDILIGGKGVDYFQLGDIAGSFYAEGGNSDYALIKDFGTDDFLILSGDPTNDPETLYRAAKDVVVDGQKGVGIFLIGGGPGGEDDLIALVQGKARNSIIGLNNSPADDVTRYL